MKKFFTWFKETGEAYSEEYTALSRKYWKYILTVNLILTGLVCGIYFFGNKLSEWIDNRNRHKVEFKN